MRAGGMDAWDPRSRGSFHPPLPDNTARLAAAGRRCTELFYREVPSLMVGYYQLPAYGISTHLENFTLQRSRPPSGTSS